ncbi:MAG: sigma 54-interacting transcriptional regulator [Thermodesulfobacteriota bacterium]
MLATHRYSKGLYQAETAQAENIAHSIALEAADKLLINDLVTLQKMLEHHIGSNPSVAYLFIVRDGQIITHTFADGFPAELMGANGTFQDDRTRLKTIISTKGDHYLDIAWPIFEGKAGILRLGLSEKPYRDQVAKLWIQMSIMTAGILLLALSVSFLFIRRFTKPLAALAEAVENIDEHQLDIKLEQKGHEEVVKLTFSFKRMIARIREYTRRLEEKTIELDRAHRQTRSCFSIVQEIGALPNLKDVSAYLIGKFQEILDCPQMQLMIFSASREAVFVLSEKDTSYLRADLFKSMIDSIKNIHAISFVNSNSFNPPFISAGFQNAERVAVFPLHHEGQLLGAMLVGCPINFEERSKEIELLDLILNQASGAIKRAALQEEEIRALQSRIENTAEYCGIIGKNQEMQGIYKLIEDVAPTDATVLIQGESGTGKEMVANAIHWNSLRKDKPFVVINCSAYPATLLESEIFGHEKGAFTGAVRQKQGRFEQADGGTVFLDEIGEIPPSAQIKLLRVLQTHKFERLGGEQTLSVNVRILAATNKNLQKEVKNGTFREDLYYRLNVIPITMPPLKKRPNDIPLLSNHFLRRFATEQDKHLKGFNTEAMRLLLDYPWPGNVRELENSIEHAVVLAKGEQIEVSDLPQFIRNADKLSQSVNAREIPTILENEKKLLEETLEASNWNKKETAQRLGISRNTLYNKIKKYQIANTKPTFH